MNQESFDKPSGSLGGMLSSLFRSVSGKSSPSGDTMASPRGGNTTRKVLGGALLAAGAAYLYNRNKTRNVGAVEPNR
jgi:hypothetical protein